MLVSDIWEEVKEATGTCDDAVNYRALTRAIQLLANKGLFDPMIATIDFALDGGYLIALPRDVKTPIRINIDNNPSFARTRLFEFAQNAPGSNDGAEIGWQWHERGYSPIQDERKLPSVLRYVVSNADIGAVVTVFGLDPEGYERSEVLAGNILPSAVAGQIVFAEIRNVVRNVTTAEGWLYADTGAIARYYADETDPAYRVVKLSQTGVACRMVYLKHIFAITAQTDIIPLDSPMAVIRAVDGVRLMMRKKYQDGTAAILEAAGMIAEEQASRTKDFDVSSAIEIAGATNTAFRGEAIIAADLYDDTAMIFGGIGKLKLFDRMTSAIQLLANKTAWDSMLATVTLTVGADGMISLPRFAYTPIRINIDNNPSFQRSRIFEYGLNTNGTESGEITGFSWSRGEESPFMVVPTVVFAVRVQGNALDQAVSLTFYGINDQGREASESILIGTAGMSDGSTAWTSISRVIKPATMAATMIFALPASPAIPFAIAAYYPDEIDPMYRRIRISKPASTIKMLFKKKIPNIMGFNDIIPLRSREAIKAAMRALKALEDGNADLCTQMEAIAVRFLTEENEAASAIGQDQELTATDTNINTNDILIVADIYDASAAAFGPIGRQKIFDKLTNCVEVLANKSQWDSLLGFATLNRSVNRTDKNRTGYYVLPRYVGAVLAVDINGRASIPRNRWFEFHLNGTGETRFSSCGTWDDAGDVAIINALPEQDCRTIIPTKVLAIPSLTDDIDAQITIYGTERLSDGRDVEVYRNGIPGWVCPCKVTHPAYPADAPAFTSITRVTKEISKGFISLFGATVTGSLAVASTLILGYWYPEEIEPRYRMIKVPGCQSARIRIRYRKRTNKITSMHDIINLRSRMAMETMIKAMASPDPSMAVGLESMAENYILEEQAANNPIVAGGLQFDANTCPAVTYNMQ